MCVKKPFCFLLCALLINFAAAQSTNINAVDSFAAKFITALRANAKQRVYFVTDKSVFAAGEYIWFKAFLLNSVSQKLSNRSKFLFVDIVNDKDTILKRVILDATDKILSSRIQFPDSLATGYYWIRAYTRQMAETDTNDVCVKALYVLGKGSNNNLAKPKKNTGNKNDIPTISFYPEGGSIMTGINSTVALRANLKNGQPLSTQVYVRDNYDTIITKLTTNANGLGKFDFEPSGYREYKAFMNWEGKEIGYPLPPFNFYAGQLSVSKQENGYNLKILLGDSIYTKQALTYVVGISKDSLVFAGIGKGLCEVFVDEKKLPEGIVTFYLFDKDFRPLSERSVYVKRSNVLVKLATDKPIYAKHDKVTVSLSITDEAQHIVPSLVAMSVTDSIFSILQDPCDFDTTALDPQSIDNLFLADNNCFTDDDIDLVMLTKNDAYKTLINTTVQPPAADNDSLLYIKGLVLNEKNAPLPQRIVTLISNSGDAFVNTDTTDNTGHFCFPFDSYSDSTSFIMEIKNLNNATQSNRVLLDSLAYPKLNTPAALKKYFTADPRLIRQRCNIYYRDQWMGENGSQLPPDTITHHTAIVDYDASKRVSPYSSLITSKDLDGRTSVDIAILKVSGLQLLDGFLVIHGLSGFKAPGSKSEPLVLVEGSEVALSSDGINSSSPVMSYLHSLDPKDIDFIEILKDGNASAYGVRGANGVILINLLHSRRDISTNKNTMNTFYVKGISKPMQFPNFSYERKNKKTNSQEDNRSTLFWNGNLLSADAGNSTFTFYTSDIPSIYNITVTGITIHGDIINQTITFQSK